MITDEEEGKKERRNDRRKERIRIRIRITIRITEKGRESDGESGNNADNRIIHVCVCGCRIPEDHQNKYLDPSRDAQASISVSISI